MVIRSILSGRRKKADSKKTEQPAPAILEALEPRLMLSMVSYSAGMPVLSGPPSDQIACDGEGLYPPGWDGYGSPLSDATPTGSSYMLYDEWGGDWSDVEKTISNTEDDLMCWAATASNVLEWTGWGLVPGMTESEQFFQHFQDHWTDDGSFIGSGWHWWFDGTEPPPGAAQVDVPGGGEFYPGENFNSYFHESWNDQQAMQTIDQYFHAGYGVGLSVYSDDGSIAHAITCWGFNYNSSSPSDYFGVWVTDSDDDKNTDTPSDQLRYFEIAFNNGWYLQDYYGRDDVSIGGVHGLERNPAFMEPEIDVAIPGESDVHSWDFQEVVIGQGQTKIFTIRNEGYANLHVSQAGGLDSPFSITPVNDSGGADDWLIAPGQMMTFDVTFDPTAIGNFNDTLVLTSNDANEADYSIDLSGRGVTLGVVSGAVWDDTNGNGVWDLGESALADWTIFLDDNQNGYLDDGETSTTSAGDGSYVFADLYPGTYTIAELLQPGWKCTLPVGQSYSVAIDYDQVETGRDFGNIPWTSADSQQTDTDEDTFLADGQVTGYDPEGDPLTFALDTGPTHGALVFNDNGSFTYQPDADYNGADFFTFTATDGTHLSDPATVSITVNPVNDAPTTADAAGAGLEDEIIEITLTGDDLETPQGELVYSVTTNPTSGVVWFVGDTAYYKPAMNYFGADSFGFVVTDTGDPAGVETSPPLSSDEAAVTITVDPVNDAPVAKTQEIAVEYAGGPIEIVLSAFDIETPLSELTFTLTSLPEKGTVALSDNIAIYTLPIGALGVGQTEQFGYSVTDEQGALSEAVVTITVTTDVNGMWVTVYGGFVAEYWDADGTNVFVSMNMGNAAMYFQGTNLVANYSPGNRIKIVGRDVQLAQLSVLKSDVRTSIYISAFGGDWRATVGSITSETPLSCIYAPNVDLTGHGINMEKDGVANFVQVRDVIGGADIVMPGNGSAGVYLVAGHLNDGTDVRLGSPLHCMVVREWTGGAFQAPWASQIYVLGDYWAGLEGNFGADVTLLGASAAGTTLGSAYIAGQVTGGMWTLNGNMAGILAVGGMADGWVLDVNGSIQYVYAFDELGGVIFAEEWIGTIYTSGRFAAGVAVNGANAWDTSIGLLYGREVADGTNVSVVGGIQTVIMTNWHVGGLQASWIGTLQTLGAAAGGADGDFGAAMVLTGQRFGSSLGYAYVAGNVTADTWNLDGDLGTFIVTGDTVDTWTLTVGGTAHYLCTYGDLAGTIVVNEWVGTVYALGMLGADITVNGANALGVSIGMLYAGHVAAADVMTAGGISCLIAADWLDGSINVLWLGYMHISGNAVAGNLGADVIMRGANDWGYSLNGAWIAGNLVNNMTWNYPLGSLVGNVYVNGVLQPI